MKPGYFEVLYNRRFMQAIDKEIQRQNWHVLTVKQQRLRFCSNMKKENCHRNLTLPLKIKF